ncbi:MAG TPA: hypothetical protein VM347_34435 [Nonomuraea sp.]|nr:hypothetical protein [Nonomuraea sp.]
MFWAGPIGLVPVTTSLIGLASAFSQAGLNSLFIPASMRPSGWVMVTASTLVLLAGFIIPVETSDEESAKTTKNQL